MDNLINEKEIQVLNLRKEGLTYAEIAKKLNMSKSLARYYAKYSSRTDKIEKQRQKLRNQEEYEKIVCNNIPIVHNLNELCKLMGKRPTNNNYLFFKRIIEKYNIDISHFSSVPQTPSKQLNLSNEEYFVLNEKKLRSSNTTKRRLLKNNIKPYQCELCGGTTWNNQPIPLELHHINGNRFDNRLENLQLLCPNCHAQTDNFAGKNQKKATYKCQYCGKEFYYGEGSSKTSKIYCSVECRKKMNQSYDSTIIRRKIREKEIIIYYTKEQLIQDFKEIGSFVGIAKKYNVSDNAVRKWFIKVNLPKHTREMEIFIKKLAEVK